MALLLLQPFRHSTFVAVEDVAGVIPAFAAAILGLWASTTSRKGRLGWRAIGFGCLLWASGEFIWTFYEVVLGKEVPFPSLADVAYLGSVPCLLLGMVALTAPGGRRVRLRVGLEALAVVAAAGAISWHLVLRPIMATDAPVIEKFISGAYPIGDLVLLFGIMASWPRIRPGAAGLVIGVLSLALIGFLFSDSLFAYLSTRDSYVSGSYVDVGWVLGNLAFGYAATRHMKLSPEYFAEGAEFTTSPLRQLVPLFVLPLIVGWALLDNLASGLGSADDPTRVFILTYLLLVVARQALAYLDTVSLSRELASVNSWLSARTEFLAERLVVEQQSADRDGLTNALTRRAILREAQALLESAQQRDGKLAVGMFDIDNLKAMNDRFGHAKGDELICQVAHTLGVETAAVGRIGGDEFVVVLVDAGETQAQAYVALVDWRLQNADQVILAPGPDVSSGFAFYPDEAGDVPGLMRIADVRMYEEKARKKRRRSTAA